MTSRLARGARDFNVVAAVTITDSATLIVPRRPGRVGVLIQNKDASTDVFIGPDNTVSGAADGFRIEANRSFFLDSQAPVWGIVASGTADVDGLEYLP